MSPDDAVDDESIDRKKRPPERPQRLDDGGLVNLVDPVFRFEQPREHGEFLGQLVRLGAVFQMQHDTPAQMPAIEMKPLTIISVMCV